MASSLLLIFQGRDAFEYISHFSKSFAVAPLMRQMDGSFGIALINTYIARRAAANRTALITNITSTDPGTAARIQPGITRFMAYGASFWQAFRVSDH